ncbi:MAG: hypothetical protein HZB46_05070 [Solirubrobacterales bacterium]|nr:hypothetical protein [Solirubrobacterales bacterium]
MTVRQLHHLLRGLDDTREVVVGRAPAGDVLHAVWRAAEDDALAAYDDWRQHPGRHGYLAYRAAADRADAALEALAEYGV